MRVAQQIGTRGSLRWIQTLINRQPQTLFEAFPQTLRNRGWVEWLSPLQTDDYAEYRDEAFLKKVGVPELANALSIFWPARGPQWDALGRAAKGDILLVEGKAHIDEICCSPTQASAKSLAQIEEALKQTVEALGAAPRAPWTSTFYQYANRLAHLYFLRRNGMPAWLIFLYFLGDEEMGGPRSIEAWRSALRVVKYTMGLPSEHSLSEYVVDVFVDVETLA